MAFLQLFLLLFLNSEAKIQETINPDYLKFKGIPFHSDKELIFKTLGKVAETRVYYECGFFSEAEQGIPYYELRYSDVTWIGNDTEGYSLDRLHFDPEGKITLEYKDSAFSRRTRQNELEELFVQEATPVKVSETKLLRWIGVPFEDRDDACHFFFEGGILVEFKYWTPC